MERKALKKKKKKKPNQPTTGVLRIDIKKNDIYHQLLHHQDAISHEQNLSTISFTSTCWKMKLEVYIYLCVCVCVYLFIYILKKKICWKIDRYQNGSLESLNKMPR